VGRGTLAVRGDVRFVAVPWLAPDFTPPARLDLETGHHLRPVLVSDVDLDYPAVMGSRERLWEIYGEVWGWPPAHMTLEADREDLAHHVAEAEANESFLFMVFDSDETEVLGCVYVEPPLPDSPPDADAWSSWWVVDEQVGEPLERELDAAVRRWLVDTWGFERVHFHP
jgi:hypothetical protein